MYEEMLAVRLPICQLSYPRAGNVVMRLIIVLQLQPANKVLILICRMRRLGGFDGNDDFDNCSIAFTNFLGSALDGLNDNFNNQKVLVVAEKFTQLVTLSNNRVSFLVVSHDSIRECVRPSVCRSVRRFVSPSVGPSVTSFFGGQKQRRQTTYFVYTSLLD